MSEEEIKELIFKVLKENISINVSTNEYWGYLNDYGVEVQVEVLLNDEIICTSSDRVSLPQCRGNC